MAVLAANGLRLRWLNLQPFSADGPVGSPRAAGTNRLFPVVVHQARPCTVVMWRLLMSLQALWSLFLAHPAQSANSLALFFAVAGAWLLLATRLREQRGQARLAAESELDGVTAQASLLSEATLRMNRFFNRFGYACLAIALAVSGISTRL
jgi:hypothetical protein